MTSLLAETITREEIIRAGHGGIIMATVGKDGGGKKRILFIDPSNGRRRMIRLGKMNLANATAIKLEVESIIAAGTAGIAVDLETAK